MRRICALPLLALLLVGLTNAATHVNISIGQHHHHEKNPADVTYVDGNAPAELRAGPANLKQQHHASDFAFPIDNQKLHEEHFGRLRSSSSSSSSSSSGSSGSDADNANFHYSQQSYQQSARLTAAGDNENRQQQHQFQQQQQQQQQRRHHNQQEKQNQEFERYIQSYHSGPTVETVFESSTPTSSQRQTSASSSSSSSSSFSAGNAGGSTSKSERVVAIGSRPSYSFERQVASPTAAPTNALLPPADDRQTHTIVNHQPKAYDVSASTSSSSSSSGAGYDQSSYVGSAVGGYDDNEVHSPPAIDEPSQDDYGTGSSSSNGYGNGHEQAHGYYGGSTPAPGYLPSYPRPVVTKTIQIAQPALKAKKYEIRHPAIQKEFYDIEERVVIKPAGTIVVELERPVAKIPKGESILPLGHPHPAVASAYNQNGAGAVVQTMDAGNYQNNYNNNNNQYSPSPVYNPKSGYEQSQHSQTPVISSTTIASTLTTTPTYDDSAKDEFVEANLNKQFNGDAQYVTTTERSFNDDKGSGNSDGGFYVTTTEQNSNRNYNPQFYGRDETDRRFVGHVDVKNNGAPGVSTAFVGGSSGGGRSYATAGYGGQSQSRSNYQPNSNNYNDNNQFKGEFLSNEFYNQPQASKPARLQEQPKQIIKHEHNIHLPASQHNIFLGRLEGPQQSQQQHSARLTNGPRYNEEAAHVLELKPYLKHHPGSVVVYASGSKRPAAAVSSVSAYNSQRNYDQGRYAQNPNSRSYQRLQYSAPYSQMRHQSERYVYGGEYRKADNYYQRHANLVADNNGNGEQSFSSSSSSSASSSHPHAHIHIQIPHHPHEADKPIVVSSTISPVVHNVKDERIAHYRQPSSGVYYDEQQRASANLENYNKPDYDYEQKSQRIIESPSSSSTANVGESSVSSGSSSIPAGNVDVSLKSAAGHIAASPGSRVIAATPAPTDAAAASESFHKRRIVVNHPFQTVREVVEHEPVTNYHHVQVSEPASPEFYHHTAPYYQQQHHETHGALRQVETLPVLYHHHSATTHGNLHYAPALPLVHGVAIGYHHG